MLPPLPAAAVPARTRCRWRSVPHREVRRRRARSRAETSSRLRCEDVLDVVLEPERHAPDDGLVRRLEPGQARLVDHLVHRARLLHRLLERPPVGGEHRPDHRAGHRHARHRTGRARRRRSRPRSRAPPEQHEPGARQVAARRPARRSRQIGASAPRPAPARRRPCWVASRNQPLVDDVSLERLVEVADRRPELGQVLGRRCSRPSSPAASDCSSRSATSSAGPIGPAALRARCASSDRVAARRLDVDADLVRSEQRPSPRGTRCSPRLARSSIAVVSARRDVRRPSPSRRTRAVRSGGGAGMRIEGRRGRPGPCRSGASRERPADEEQEDDRRADQPDDGVDLARRLELRPRAPGWPRRRPSSIAATSAPSKSPARRSGSMSFSKIAWRSLLDRNAASKPGAGVELDLAVHVGRVEVEEDDHAVVEALRARRPTGRSARVASRLGLLGRRRRSRPTWRVDHDLGAGPLPRWRRSSPRRSRSCRARRCRRSRRRRRSVSGRGTADRAAARVDRRRPAGAGSASASAPSVAAPRAAPSAASDGARSNVAGPGSPASICRRPSACARRRVDEVGRVEAGAARRAAPGRARRCLVEVAEDHQAVIDRGAGRRPTGRSVPPRPPRPRPSSISSRP